MRPGLYRGLSYAEYDAIPALRWSILRHGRKSMAHLRHAMTTPQNDTDAFRVGRALHCAVLEPDAFGRRFVTLPPDAPRKPTARQVNAKKKNDDAMAAIEWWAAFTSATSGADILTSDELALVMKMADAVRADPVAGPIVALPGHREVTAVWDDPETGVRCKARPDLMVRVDDATWRLNLKTSRSASPEDFPREIANLGYHCQDAFEAMGLETLAPVKRQSAWIVVEKTPPYCVCVYTPTPAMMRQGRNEVGRLLSAYAEARAKNVWPGHLNEITPVEIPMFAREPGYDD